MEPLERTTKHKMCGSGCHTHAHVVSHARVQVTQLQLSCNRLLAVRTTTGEKHVPNGPCVNTQHTNHKSQAGIEYLREAKTAAAVLGGIDALVSLIKRVNRRYQDIVAGRGLPARAARRKTDAAKAAAQLQV